MLYSYIYLSSTLISRELHNYNLVPYNYTPLPHLIALPVLKSGGWYE